MDEPTAALGVLQRGRVLDMMRRVAGRGVSGVLISHNMPEVLAIADRVEVLRLGRKVAAFEARNTSVEELVGAMTGALDVPDRPAGQVRQGRPSWPRRVPPLMCSWPRRRPPCGPA